MEGAEKAGNYIRRDHSLVLRKKRCGRFSQKFRDGVVDRLTTGKTSIGQLCVELKVTEADIVAWIGDLLERRQDRISELSRLVDSLAHQNTYTPRLETEISFLDENSDSIEGRFDRRAVD